MLQKGKDCFRDTLKSCLLSARKPPKMSTAKKYLKNRIDSIAAPLFISGTAKSGFSPYVIPVIIPAGYPIIAFLLNGFISLQIVVAQAFMDAVLRDRHSFGRTKLLIFRILFIHYMDSEWS